VDIEGKNALVLGGYGLVGMAVCRRLLGHQPARLVVSSLRREESEAAVAELRAAFPALAERIRPAWGDILLRAEWAGRAVVHPRQGRLGDAVKRRRLVGDILDELNDEIPTSSPVSTHHGSLGLDGPAHIIVDCVNTVARHAYHNALQTAAASKLIRRRRADQNARKSGTASWRACPQLVRHADPAMKRCCAPGRRLTQDRDKRTGGWGSTSYTHGEEAITGAAVQVEPWPGPRLC
jgi:NAD(P)-dependent dehydrogenase (short-subunit alcohol dehydrogenase family)